MQPTRREFKVGKLVVLGDKFEFHPERELMFDAHPGDIVDLYVHYGYKEASRDKETLDLRFTVELNGKVLGTRATRVEDSRVVPDEQWGLLKHETSIDAKGTLKGRFTLEAMYDKAAWSGKGGHAITPFKQVGTFVVNVR